MAAERDARGRFPKGNGSKGAGWGGPAKGAGRKLGADPARDLDIQRAGGALSPGEGKQARARALMEEAAPLAAQVLIDVARNLDDPRAVQAAQAILNRVGLHEKSGVEMTGKDGGALAVTVEIVDASAAGNTPGA